MTGNFAKPAARADGYMAPGSASSGTSLNTAVPVRAGDGFPRLPTVRRLTLAAAMALALAGCGKEELPADVLAYIPADTPYVMANSKGMPDDVVNAWMSMYGDSLSQMYVDMAENPELAKIDDELGVWIRAAVPELAQLMSPSNVDKVGLSFASPYAFYGVDLLPVYRLQVKDAAKLEAMFKRIEERAGKPIPLKKVGEIELKQVANDKAQVLFGVVGPYFVAALAPASADDARLQALIGLELPEETIADSGALSKLDQEMGYTGHFSGYIDIVSVFKRLSGQSAADNALMAAFGGDVPDLTPQCQLEMALIASKMPRAVFGAREFSAKRMDINTVLQVEAASATAMQGIAAPVPGAGATQPALFRVALSANVPAAVKFLGGVADAINAQPFQCEDLKSLNDSALELKSNLANPGLAMAGSVTAAHVGLTALQLEPGAEMPSELSGFAAVGTPTPLMLWGLAQQSIPALATVTLPTDGSIVALPDETVPTPMPIKLKALMNEKVLAMATSDVDDAALTALGVVDTNDGTILRYAVGGEFFAMIDRLMPPTPAEMPEYEAKMAEHSRQMMAALGSKVDVIDVRVQLTGRGFEMNQVMTLK